MRLSLLAVGLPRHFLTDLVLSGLQHVSAILPKWAHVLSDTSSYDKITYVQGILVWGSLNRGYVNPIKRRHCTAIINYSKHDYYICSMFLHTRCNILLHTTNYLIYSEKWSLSIWLHNIWLHWKKVDLCGPLLKRSPLPQVSCLYQFHPARSLTFMTTKGFQSHTLYDIAFLTGTIAVQPIPILTTPTHCSQLHLHYF